MGFSRSQNDNKFFEKELSQFRTSQNVSEKYVTPKDFLFLGVFLKTVILL